ncbi:hypothetical protein ACVU7I_01175 [Patulibacter sp. S7RM1-6]
MSVHTTPEALAVDLRTYGEEELADRVAGMTEDELEPVFQRADHYVYHRPDLCSPSGAGPLLALCLSLAAVEVLEGEARPLRWKRRKLKGIYPGC